MNNVLISKLPHTWGSLSLNGQLSRDYEHHLEIQRHIHIFYIVSHKSSHAHFSHVGLVGSAVLKSHWLQLKCDVLMCSSNMLIFKFIGIWCWIAAFIAFHIIYPPMNPLLMSCTLIISALFVLTIMIKSIFVVSLAPWNTDFITLNTLHFELRVSTLESEEA